MGRELLEKTYEHVQDVQANVWVIEHNLGTSSPVVDITLDDVIGNDQIMIAYDVIVDSNIQVTVTLNNPAGSPLPDGHTGRALVA